MTRCDGKVCLNLSLPHAGGQCGNDDGLQVRITGIDKPLAFLATILAALSSYSIAEAGE